MDAKYIFAIVILGVFFVLIFVSFAFLEYGRIKEQKLRAWINELYDSKEVKKYDYDADDEDDGILEQETESSAGEVEDSDEEIAEVEQFVEAFDKIDV